LDVPLTRRHGKGLALPSIVPLCALIALTLSVAASSQTPPQFYIVIRVIDGDTVVLERIGTVRLIGVDTPEVVDTRQPVQRFGREASEFTRRLIAGKPVRVEYDWNRRDRYRRTLAYLYLQDGTFVNAEIIRQGYGLAYTPFAFKYMDAFAKIQAEAQEKQRGLWKPESPASGLDPQRAVGSSRTNPEIVDVYVTRTGTKFHRADCRLLAQSRIRIALTEATKRYGPCAVCRPPVH
jgi:micrococcal nuclease